MSIVTAIFGDRHSKTIKQIQPLVEEINAFEATVSALSDVELRAKTDIFKTSLTEGQDSR